MMKKGLILCFVFLFIMFLLTTSVSAANHYVRSGATGSANGNDWTNAYTNLPASLIRGDTYYIAEGNYGGHYFNDAGTSTIYIKKANSVNHGIGTGWLDSYGDGQAYFGTFQFDSGNYDIDGGYRNEGDWSDDSSYGFKFGSSSSTGYLFILDPGANNYNVQNVRISHVHAYYTNCCTASDSNINHHFAARYGGGNLYIGNSLLENISWGASILINNVNNFTIENNYFKDIRGKELVSAISGTSNVVFRNNFVKNIGGTLAIGKKGTGSYEVYNNVFWSPNSAFRFSDGRVLGDWTNQGSTSSNWKVYGNTFYNLGSANIAVDSGTGNTAQNNLFIGYIPSFSGFTSSSSITGASTSVVLNANGGDFHLFGATTAGANIGAPYNADMEGNTRGSDGNWDIGAYEYSAPAVCTNCRYVTPNGAGSMNGSDWSNAYADLPLTLTRGYTYYVAGGSYPSYTFNTVESGTTLIGVKKATSGDHGTDTGWQSAYGTSQAVFSSYFNIERGYFVIDGQYRNEGDWFNGSAYGFKIQNTGNWQHIRIMDPAGTRAVSNVSVEYVYIAAIVGQLPSTCENHCTQAYGPCAINTNTENPALYNTGYLFSHMYVEGSNNPYFLRYLKNPTIEYSASEKTSGSSCWHGETVNLYYSSQGAGTIRYNHFRDQYNGASGYAAGGATGNIVFSDSSGAQVYGNVIERYTVGNGAIAANWPNSNLKIHHNTFVDGGYYSDRPVIAFPDAGNAASGNEAYDNLRVNTISIPFFTGQGTSANNSDETSSVFLNYVSHDYRLARQTNVKGSVLSSPYNIDKSGNVFGSDGYVDTGAYEYVSGGASPIDGVCSTSTPNTCTSSAAPTGISQSGGNYIWTCPGSNGGNPVSCSMPIPAAKFVIGDRVYVSGGNGLYIRDSPAGTSLGQQDLNSLGTITGGPTNAALSGTTYTWWSVDFDSGTDGWTVEGWLEKYVASNNHPADTNGNLILTSAEVSTYINSYFAGSTTLSQVLYAMALLQKGGSYSIIGNANCANAPWACWN